jgi:hypothetical protein
MRKAGPAHAILSMGRLASAQTVVSARCSYGTTRERVAVEMARLWTDRQGLIEAGQIRVRASIW